MSTSVRIERPVEKDGEFKGHICVVETSRGTQEVFVPGYCEKAADRISYIMRPTKASYARGDGDGVYTGDSRGGQVPPDLANSLRKHYEQVTRMTRGEKISIESEGYLPRPIFFNPSSPRPGLGSK